MTFNAIALSDNVLDTSGVLRYSGDSEEGEPLACCGVARGYLREDPPVTEIQSARVADRVRGIGEVATLPSVFARVLALVQNESSTALDLAAEISADPALTLRVLRTVNSSYYGFSRQIQTIPDAVVLLGFGEIERLALAISVINLFGRDPENTRALHKLWQHSIAASVVGSVFEARWQGTRAFTGAHVACLLHDVGKAVVAQFLPEALAPILQLMSDEGMASCDAERSVLEGTCHCEIGAWIAEQWGLPAALVESIALHHTPENVLEDHPLVHVAHLADALCNSLGFFSVSAKQVLLPHPRSSETLRLDSAVMTSVRDHLYRQQGLLGAVAGGALA